LESDRAQELLARAGLESIPLRLVARTLAVGVVAIGIAVWRFWPAPAVEVETAQPAITAAETQPTAPAESVEATRVVVHVAGAVLRPGVYTLEPGARVADAVALAGGLLGSADAAAVNLARILADGEQVYFPVQGESAPSAGGAGGPASAGGAGSAGTVDGKVDINHADAATLETLPGIGPATAQKIIDEREANGPYASVEDLMRVAGIGEKRVAALADLVVVR
jgi:competence protein ComEA